MTYMKPCRRCPHREGCVIKKEKLALLRKAQVSSVNFHCEKRVERLEPGRKVEFVLSGYRSEGYEGRNFDFTGVIMRPVGQRLMVWSLGPKNGNEEISPTPSGRNPIALYPDRLTPLDETVKVAPCCGQPEGTEPQEREDGNAYRCYTCHPPEIDHMMNQIIDQLR